MHSYETVSEAVTGLQKRGFTVDFNLESNCRAFKNNQNKENEFEIMEHYRFEGNSDPADEAVVYAIESKSGIKGILVNGFGTSSDTLINKMVEKLKIHYKYIVPVFLMLLAHETTIR